MPDIRQLYDKKFLYHYDLPKGRDVVLTIAHVKQGKVTDKDGQETKKPLIYFEELIAKGIDKGWAAPITVARDVIGKMYGFDYTTWGGKRVQLYRTMVSSFGKQVEAIRCRPKVPREKPSREPVAHAPEPEVTGTDNDTGEDASV